MKFLFPVSFLLSAAVIPAKSLNDNHVGLESAEDSHRRSLVNVQDYTHYVLTDKHHGKQICYGGNRRVSVDDQDGTNNCHVFFPETAYDGWTYIRTVVSPHLLICVGANREVWANDEAWLGRKACMWKQHDVTNNYGFEWFENFEFRSQYLTAGYTYDGNLYLTNNNDEHTSKQQSWWKVDRVGGGSQGTGRKFPP